MVIDGPIAGWLIVHDEYSSDIVHVIPNFGRDHDENDKCWCGPHWDTEGGSAVRILIHECDN